MNDLIAVKKLAEWQRLKALVLDSVSPITRRVYNMALNELIHNYVRAWQLGAGLQETNTGSWLDTNT